MTKQCSNCKLIKFLTDFHKDKTGTLGVRHLCKVCSKIYSKKWWKKGIVKHREKARLWYQNNPYKSRLFNWRKQGVKISIEEYKNLVISQNGLCAICKQHENTCSTKLCVDHDHKTGKIRGLLCRDCNSGLGHFHEIKESLTKAIEYLEKYNGNN